MKRREFVAVATAAVSAGCLDNGADNESDPEDSEPDETTDDANETDVSDDDATEDGLTRGDVNIIDEEYHVDSPYGEGSADSLRIVNGDGKVRCTVEVLEDDEVIYSLRIHMGPFATYTDGIEIAREGEYEVRLETEDETLDDTWTVGEGYPRFVVEPYEPGLTQVESRGHIEVETPESVPEDADPVSSETISEYEPVYDAIEEHHSCETGPDEDCETIRTVSGTEWVTATRAVDEYGTDDERGVHVEYEDNVYIFAVETEL